MQDTKHKNITEVSAKILADLNRKSITWFSLDKAYSMFQNMSKNQIRGQIKRMTDEGLLMRVREGVYYTIPYEQDSETFMPDWHLLAEPLVGPDYYIGYYSTLQTYYATLIKRTNCYK